MKLQRTHEYLYMRGSSRHSILFAVAMFSFVAVASSFVYQERASTAQSAQYAAAVRTAITGTTTGDYIMGTAEYDGEIGDALVPVTTNPGAICLPASQIQAMQTEINALRQAARDADIPVPEIDVLPTLSEIPSRIRTDLGTLANPEDLRNYQPLEIPDIVEITDLVGDGLDVPGEGFFEGLGDMFRDSLSSAGRMCTAALEGLIPGTDPDSLEGLNQVYGPIADRLGELLNAQAGVGGARMLDQLNPEQLASLVSSLGEFIPDTSMIPGFDDVLSELPFSEELADQYTDMGFSELAERARVEVNNQTSRLVDELRSRSRNTDRRNPPDLSGKTCAQGMAQLKDLAKERRLEWYFVCLKFEDGTERWSLVCPRIQTETSVEPRVECLNDVLRQGPRIVEAWDVHTHPGGAQQPPSPDDISSADPMRRLYPEIGRWRFFAIDELDGWEFGIENLEQLFEEAMLDYASLPEVNAASTAKYRALRRTPTEADRLRITQEVNAEVRRGMHGQRARDALNKMEVLSNPRSLLRRELVLALSQCGGIVQSRACADKFVEVYRRYGITVRRTP